MGTQKFMRTDQFPKPKRRPRLHSQQLEFGGQGFFKPRDCFGGGLLKNSNAKTKRPLDSKLPIHLSLRTSWGRLRLPKTFAKVNQAVADISRKHGVRIYKYANVGNHLHLLIKVPRLSSWAAFIRELSGRVAQIAQGITGPEKGRKFWAQRPFTRIVRGWREAFQTIKQYIVLNELETNGFISRKETKTLKDLRLIFAVG